MRRYGVFYSANLGVSWTNPLPSTSARVYALTQDPKSSTTLWAGGRDPSTGNGVLWKSTNIGKSWTEVAIPALNQDLGPLPLAIAIPSQQQHHRLQLDRPTTPNGKLCRRRRRQQGWRQDLGQQFEGPAEQYQPRQFDRRRPDNADHAVPDHERVGISQQLLSLDRQRRDLDIDRHRHRRRRFRLHRRRASCRNRRDSRRVRCQPGPDQFDQSRRKLDGLGKRNQQRHAESDPGRPAGDRRHLCRWL